jgi:hypothetical protein
MGIFDSFASSMSGQKRNSNNSYSNSGSYEQVNAQQQVMWQCRYCGQRTGTWGNSIPARGICHNRPSMNGQTMPHHWERF